MRRKPFSFPLLAVIAFFACSCKKSEEPRWPSRDTYRGLHAQFEGAFPGRGRVDYGKNEVADIAKAYAMVLKAELNRERAGGLPELPSLVKVAGLWLLDHADEDGDKVVGWGVPLGWDAFGDGSPNPPNAEYTISTAISVDALLDWLAQDREAPRGRILETVTDAVSPYLRQDALSPSGLFPYSLEPQDRPYDVFNPAAYLAGQMQRLSRLSHDKAMAAQLSTFADRTVAVLIAQKKTDASGDWYWAYSVQEDPIPNDLAHAVYVMHGLRDYALHGGRLAREVPLAKVSAHLSQFFPAPKDVPASEPLQAHELYVHGWPLFRTDTKLPARSYGVGMALYFAAFDPTLRDAETRLAASARLYDKQNGEFSKYPHREIGEHFKPTEKDSLVIQEYQAYMLLGLSHHLFRPPMRPAVGTDTDTNTDAEARRKADFAEKPYELTLQRLAVVLDAYRPTDLERFQTIPFTRFDTAKHKIQVEFHPRSRRSRAIVDKTKVVSFERPGVPLKVLDFGKEALAVVYKEIPSNRLFLYHVAMADGAMRETPLDARAETNLLMRGAVVHAGRLVLVLYDNVKEFNFLHRFRVERDSFVSQGDRLQVPSVEDPAGTHYEMIPRVTLRSEADGLYLFSGRLAAVLRNGTLTQFARPKGCWRILDTVRASTGWVALCNTEEPQPELEPQTAQRHKVIHLTTGEEIPLDPEKGAPWRLSVTDSGDLRWNIVEDVGDLREMFLHDIATGKNSGVLNFGSNNVEGRVPWSQIDYLNGFLDILYLARRDNRAYDVFQPLLADVKRRIDLEMYLLDTITGEMGFSTRAFTVEREPGVFAVQTARLLMVFDRYRREVENPLPLLTDTRIKTDVYELQGHMEVFTDKGEAAKWLAPGAIHLRWPKGNSFYFDGVNVPYNHQNEWAYAVFATSDPQEGEKSRARHAAEDIIGHFLRHVADDDGMPASGQWPYWWGTAYDGWNEEAGVSVNTPKYAGDKSNAWIYFRTIDTMAVLSARRFMEDAVSSTLVQSAVRLVNRGAIYPFGTRELNVLGHYPALSEGVARHYLRASAPWDIANVPWAYLRITLKAR